MIRARSALAAVVGVALLVAACSRHAATTATNTAANPAAAASVADAPVAAAAKPKGAAPGSAEATTITRINEDGSESVEDTTSDSVAHNPILAAVAATISSTAVAATLSAPTPWQEGVNYTRLVPAQPTSVAPGQVEVIEFFWYACPHCNAIDPLVEAWRKTKAPYISFSREHVMWQEGHRSLARMFYTLQSLNKLD